MQIQNLRLQRSGRLIATFDVRASSELTLKHLRLVQLADGRLTTREPSDQKRLYASMSPRLRDDLARQAAAMLLKAMEAAPMN